MSILLLEALRLGIKFSYIKNNDKIIDETIIIKKNKINEKSDYNQIIKNIYDLIRKKNNKPSPLLIAIHSIYGGSEFKDHLLVNENTISKLKKMITNSAIHINLLMDLIKNCQKIFHQTPIKIFFETSFFTNLPEQERYYAIDSNLSNKYRLIRFGYHGLYHEEALDFIKKKCQMNDDSDYKILSICLDKNSEIAGIRGKKPVFVSSGSTQLEGLPGEKRCGKIDSSIILNLVNKLKWGPEKINQLLIQESGIYGLTDKKMSLNELFSVVNSKYQLAKNLFKYQLLLETGAAISAMGGLDYVIFSGIYHKLGKNIKNYFNKKALFKNRNIQFDFLKYNSDEIIIDRLINNNKLLFKGDKK